MSATNSKRSFAAHAFERISDGQQNVDNDARTIL
jgi:hypothetical protein